MHSRGLLLLSLVLAVGCQDKKPDGSAPAASTTNTPTGAVGPVGPGPNGAGPPPLDGTIDGKVFLPDKVSLEALRDVALLTFSQTVEKQETSIQIQLPVPETEKVGGREWTCGGKVDDP